MGNELIEAVEEDSSLSSAEKENTIRFAKDEDVASVFTEEAGLMRRLLQHPHFEVESVRLESGREVAPNDFEKGSITGVKGNIPVEAVVLQTSLRETSQHSAVVPESVLRREQTVSM